MTPADRQPVNRQDEIAQMCDAPSSAYLAGEWCEAAAPAEER